MDLCNLNRERQRIEGNMFKEALEMLDRAPAEAGPVVLASSKWHQGVAGIVASKIVERIGLPVVIICVRNGVGRGSCRSMDGFNIYEALSKCGDMLLSFGGHEMAAGLTVEEQRIDDLKERLKDIFASGPAVSRERLLSVDFEVIKPRLMTLENIEALETLEPYGDGQSPAAIVHERRDC